MKQNNETLAEATQTKITIIANSIRRITPKTVTITRSHYDQRHPYTVVELSIEPELYTTLLQTQAATASRYETWLPFVFLINGSNKAYDMMPRGLYIECQKRAQQELKQAKTSKIEVQEVGEANHD